jgi:hypothetical protein
MVMGMLAAGGLQLLTDGARTADADNPKGYYEYERVKDLDKALDTAWLGAARGKGLKVISFLLKHLPDAFDYKIILVRRNISEVLASQRKMLERRGEPSTDADDEDLERAFEGHLANVDRDVRRRANCQLLYVDHAEILRAPAKVAGEIGEFLRRPLDVDRMAAAVDGQLYRNRS